MLIEFITTTGSPVHKLRPLYARIKYASQNAQLMSAALMKNIVGSATYSFVE